MPPSESLVVFQSSSRDLPRQELRSYAERLAHEVAGGRTFCCLITGDDDLRRLNRQFLAADYATDVLSFPSAGPAESLGDVAISVDRARQQAREHGHSTAEEVKILMLHGVLHLLGMDHETDRGAMRRAEHRWRRRLELPAGLIDRVHA
jgi:probable rRNA maturation factor